MVWCGGFWKKGESRKGGLPDLGESGEETGEKNLITNSEIFMGITMTLFSGRKEGRQKEVTVPNLSFGLYYASTTFSNFIVIGIGSRGQKH